jgi:hypothetical protein
VAIGSKSFIIIIMVKIWVILFIFPKDSFAYIDPSPGNYLFQLIIGILGSGLLLLKINFNRIKDFIKKYFFK